MSIDERATPPRSVLSAIRTGLGSGIFAGWTATACGGMLVLEHWNYGNWFMIMASGSGVALGIYSAKKASEGQQYLQSALAAGMITFADAEETSTTASVTLPREPPASLL